MNNSDSVWVKWINIHRLKGNSIWDVKVSKGAPWSWKKLLDLRDLIKQFIWFKIGDGKMCNVWFDKWYNQGPICNHIDRTVIVNAGMDLKAKIADLIDDQGWVWPIEWDGVFDAVINIPVPNLNSSINDKVIWIDKRGVEVQFSCSEVWKAIKDESPDVIWNKHVWFNQCIPRHAFILWTAIKGRLKTRDRLAKWFSIGDRRCLLCNQEDESHSHLFFSCVFSKRLWERLKSMARLENVGNDWASVISAIVNKAANNTIWSVIQRLVFGACVYYIWNERNCRRVNHVCRSEEGVFKSIVDTVRLKLLGLNLKYTSQVCMAAELWNIPLKGNVYYRRMINELANENL